MDEIIEEARKKYQGLVPLVYDIETMGLDEARPEDMPYAVYLKREADEVITEKDKELHRQKFKRCFAMAMWCRRNRLHASVCGPVEKIDFWEKWHERWLELAEKFKGAR